MNKYFLGLAVILLIWAIYLNTSNLDQYEKDDPIDESYPHTWLVQDSTAKQLLEAMDDSTK